MLTTQAIRWARTVGGVILMSAALCNSHTFAAIPVDTYCQIDGVDISVDQALAPGVHATGVAMLGDVVLTAGVPARYARVFAFHVTISRATGERIEFYGTPLVDVGSSAPMLSTRVFTRPRPGEVGPRFDCRAWFEPSPGKTWGTVTEPDDLIVRFDYAE